MKTIFEEGRTTNGASGWHALIAGITNIYVYGDLGGGTLTLQALAPDDATAVDVEELAIGLNTVDAASFVARVNLSGATDPNFSVIAERENVDLAKAVRVRANE